MSQLFNRVKFTSSTSGTAAFGVGAAITGFRTPATASVADGTLVSYTAESSDRSQWETGHGTYNTAGPTISRTTVLENSSGTTSAINFSAAPTLWLDLLAQDVREVLTADRTYYVRTTGSDSNGGLTSGAAFLTVQHAMNVISSTLDLAGYRVTVDVGAGTFAGVGVKSWVGGGTLYFKGAGSSSTTLIDGPNDFIFNSGEAIAVYFPIDGQLYANGCTYQASDSGFYNIQIAATCQAFVADPDGGGATGDNKFVGNAYGDLHVVFPGATLQVYGTIGHSGNTPFFARVEGGGYCLISNVTCTLTGTPAFSQAFVVSTGNAYLSKHSTTFSGAATGKRFNVTLNAIIDAETSGLSFFPGDTAGTVASGGVYSG